MGLIEIFKSSNTNLGNFDSFSPKNQKSNHLSASTPPVGQLTEVQLPVFIISADSTLPNHPVQRHQMASPVTTLGSSALSDHHPRRTDHHPPLPPPCPPHSSQSPSRDHHLHLPSPTHPHLHPASLPSVPASPSPSIHSSECSSLSLASATSAFASAASPIVITNRRLLACWRRLERLPFIGLLFALGSVLFWSSNGLFFKLNKQIHVLETLTISSFLVCLLFLCIIVLFYDRNYATAATETDDRTSNGSTTGNSDHCCTSSRWTIIFGIPGERTNLAMRSILGTVSLACFYTAYSYIPLGDATTIRFTSPVFIAIFAHFMVAEPFGILQIINCCTTLAGVVLIGRPSFLFPSKTKVSIASSSGSSSSSSSAISTKNRQPPQFPLMMNATRINQTEFNIVEYFSSPDHFMILSSAAPSLEPNRTLSLNEFGGIQPNEGSVTSTTIATLATLPSTTNVLFGVLLALVAAITISISMIYMKKLKQTPAPLVIFWFSLSNVILGAAGMTILGEFRWPTGVVVWTLILLTTLCSAFDQLFITMALKLENTGAVAVIQALCVVLSFVFSILILSEPLYLTSALGGVFIFISVIVLGTGKMLQDVTSPQSKEGATNFLNNILNLKLFLCKLHSKKSKKSQSFDIVSQHNFVDGPSYDNNTINNSHNVDECYVAVAPSCADKSNHHHHYSSLLLRNEPCLLRIVPISSDLSSVAPSVESVTNYPTTNESQNHHKSLNLQLSFDSQNAKMLQNLKKF